MAFSRASPFSSSPDTRGFDISRDHLGKELLKSGNEVTPGHVCSSGVPSSLKCREGNQYKFGKISSCFTYLKILNISSISESPGNKGFRVHISAKMQPTDHMSTPVEYCRPPSKISGDLYHRVTTWKNISSTHVTIIDLSEPHVCMSAEEHQKHGPNRNLPTLGSRLYRSTDFVASSHDGVLGGYGNILLLPQAGS